MLMIPPCTFPRLSIDEVHSSRREDSERLTSDLSKISDWGKANLVLFNASKTQFLHLSTRHNLPNNYPLFFNDTQLSPSPTLNILGLSFTCNLNCKLHISSSMKLGVLSRLRQFYSPPQLLTLYRGLIRPCMEIHYTCLGRLHLYSSIEQGGIKSFSSYQLLFSD